MKIVALSLRALTVVASIMSTTGSSAAVTATTTAAVEEERGVVPEEVISPHHRVNYGKKTTHQSLPTTATANYMAENEVCHEHADCCGCPNCG